MKRSEMLNKIRAALEGKVRQGDYAEEVLSVLESLGMAPPEIHILKDSYDRSSGTYGYWVHEWEDENET